MKKLIIICEGTTELFFCQKILAPYLSNYSIEVEHPLISHSNGGIVKWIHLKNQIIDTLNNIPNCFVTTFVDYYGMEVHHDFPDWNISLLEANKILRMDILEKGMFDDIPPLLQTRFIPYIQLHEFEGLVFSNYDAFQTYYEPAEADFNQLRTICNTYLNPELINDSVVSAPSKRLQASIIRYDKVSHGVDICEIIGINMLRQKCPRFNDWITKFENL